MGSQKQANSSATALPVASRQGSGSLKRRFSVFGCGKDRRKEKGVSGCPSAGAKMGSLKRLIRVPTACWQAVRRFSNIAAEAFQAASHSGGSLKTNDAVAMSL